MYSVIIVYNVFTVYIAYNVSYNVYSVYSVHKSTARGGGSVRGTPSLLLLCTNNTAAVVQQQHCCCCSERPVTGNVRTHDLRRTNTSDARMTCHADMTPGQQAQATPAGLSTHARPQERSTNDSCLTVLAHMAPGEKHERRPPDFPCTRNLRREARTTPA